MNDGSRKPRRWVTAIVLGIGGVIFAGFAGFEAFYPDLAASAEPSPPSPSQRALRVALFAVPGVLCAAGSVRALRR